MTDLPVNREPVVGHLTRVWASTVSACDRLTRAQWATATECPGWSVKDQLSHLIGVERTVMGDSSPPVPAVLPGHVANAFGAMNEAWVEARRSVPGPEVLVEFVETIDRRGAALRAMPESRFDETGWSPTGEATYREFLDSRVLDCWVHQQDVRRALGRPGDRNGAGEAAVLDRCGRTMPYVVGRRVAPADGSSVLFNITGVMGRQLLVVMEDGRARIAGPGDHRSPSAVLLFDQEAFWRLCFGRMDSTRVTGDGRARIGGDVALDHRVLESMAFIA